MIHQFSYSRAASHTDAGARLAAPGAVPLGGGTDLLVCIKENLAHPREVVDLTRIPQARQVTWLDDGGVRIGAAVRVAELARDARIRDQLPALSEACESVGTPALRYMGTIAGNLCQRPRCWYFRRGVPCFKNGRDGCPAADGENQYHAILGGGPCYIVHPSDPAVALTALDAVVELRRGRAPAEREAVGDRSDSADDAMAVRRVPIGEFYVLPAERLDHETILRRGEYVSAVYVPGASTGGVQGYQKVMQRGAWDFAIVSVAAVRRRDGGVRLVLGGVAPRPWRVTESVEEDVASGGLGEDDIATLAERALYDARPLSKNGYKVELAAAVLRRGIGMLMKH